MANAQSTTLGQRIRDLRLEKRWTQEELAAAAGISKSFLSEVEQAASQPRGPILVKLARALGASIDFLMTGRNPAAPEAAPVEVPQELAAMAERRAIPFRHVRALLEVWSSLAAFRSDNRRGRPTEDEWERRYDEALSTVGKDWGPQDG